MLIVVIKALWSEGILKDDCWFLVTWRDDCVHSYAWVTLLFVQKSHKTRLVVNHFVSRHTVMYQRPRKLCGTQVCYLQETLTHYFEPLICLQLLGRFLSDLLILCPPYTRPYIPNLKEIGPVVREIYGLENCPIFLTFFFFFAPFYKSNFEPKGKTPFPLIDFFQIWCTYKALCGLS